MAEGVPMGKRMVGVRPVFSGLHRVRVRRPLSPVCALGTSPKRGSALRGGGRYIQSPRTQRWVTPKASRMKKFSVTTG